MPSNHLNIRRVSFRGDLERSTAASPFYFTFLFKDRGKCTRESVMIFNCRVVTEKLWLHCTPQGILKVINSAMSCDLHQASIPLNTSYICIFFSSIIRNWKWSYLNLLLFIILIISEVTLNCMTTMLKEWFSLFVFH